MDRKLIYLLVFLISLVSVNAILPDIYCEVLDSNGLFCFGNNTIYPSIMVRGGTRGEFRIPAPFLTINTSLNVIDEITINGNPVNTTVDLDKRYYTQTQVDNDTIIRDHNRSWYLENDNNFTNPNTFNSNVTFTGMETMIHYENITRDTEFDNFINYGNQFTLDNWLGLNYTTGWLWSSK